MSIDHEEFSMVFCEVKEVLSVWAANTILSREEVARAERFAARGPARTFMAGRLLLRHLVAQRSDCRPQDVVLRLAPGGKPVVENPAGTEVNLSHSQGWVLAAAGRVQLGIDMEAVRPMDWQTVTRRFLPPSDRSWLDACPPESRDVSFFHLWTWKEAVAKAVGSGISLFAELPPPCDMVHVAGRAVHVSSIALPPPFIGHLAVVGA